MSQRGSDPSGAAELGWVAADLSDEFPELALRFLEVPAVTGRSPRAVRDRLEDLANRFRGPQVLALRQDPVPWAYRVFFRHIGLDPDVHRTPMEALAVRRLMKGGFPSAGLPDDALTLAVLEGGVPVWALDAAVCDGPLGIRPAAAGERLGDEVLAPGRLVVADAVRPLSVLFGDPAPDAVVVRHTRRMLLYSVQVAGVPELNVEEALWDCLEVLASGAAPG